VSGPGRVTGDAGSTVVAAGGILLRRASDGSVEVALVHRPARHDWSFPKGKLDRGETLQDGARREVLEETGLACEIGPFAGQVAYRDRDGRPKTVDYWVMRPTGGCFSPNREVDELRWVGPDEALALLSYDHDRQLLAAVLRAHGGAGGPGPARST